MRASLPWFSRNAIALSAVALSVGVLAACTSSGSSSSSSSTSPSASASSSANTTPISIGASLSLTGDFSADGLAFQKGYNLWAKDVNAAGGIMGRQVKLTILNDASSPNQVVTNYQTLINTDHVDLTFGPFSSLLTAPGVGGGGPQRLRVHRGRRRRADGVPDPAERGRPQRLRRVPAGRGRDHAVRELHREPAGQPAAEDRGVPDGPGPVRRPAGAARPAEAAGARREDRLLEHLPCRAVVLHARRPTTWRARRPTSWCSAPPTCPRSRRS